MVLLVDQEFRFFDQTGNAKTLKPTLMSQIAKDANLITVEARMYTGIDKEFASHNVITHSINEYVRGNAHTNTIEGFFSRLKRGLIGTYHHYGSQQLIRYMTEM